jgi:hypothetical protein
MPMAKIQACLASIRLATRQLLCLFEKVQRTRAEAEPSATLSTSASMPALSA